MAALEPVGRPPLARRAQRLVEAAARKSFDPFTTIDWSVPVDDRAFHLPPELLPLYGTPAWHAMSEPERIALSRHECAALCGTGIWLENILMRLLVDHLYELDAGDGVHRFLLTEIADECRHSSMFGEYIRRAGTPAYRPAQRLRREGRVVRSLYGRASAFIAVLAAEELLDAMNRATMADPALHPVSRGMARLHVIEEARHVSFARTWLAQELPRLSRASRFAVRMLAPLTVRTIADATVDPEVYKTLGIPGGARLARQSPHHQARVRRDLSKLVDFLGETEVITPWTRPLWQTLGLSG